MVSGRPAWNILRLAAAVGLAGALAIGLGCRASTKDGAAPAARGADDRPFTDDRTGVTWIPIPATTYALARTETTVAQFRRCVDAGGCSADKVVGVEWKESAWGPSDKCNYPRAGYDEHPMNCVDWHDADAYCRWAGARLISKEEWHEEASEGGRRIYPWDGDTADCEHAVMNDWMSHGGSFRQGCGKRGTWPVCSKPKGNSVHDLCDVAGNVWEWTDTKEFPGPETEPRYNLGGSFANTPPYLEVEYTLVNPTRFRIDVLGIRCRIAR